MKFAVLLLAFFVLACDTDEPVDTSAADKRAIEREVAEFHRAIERAYNSSSMNTDSLIDDFFSKDMYYVTYWGISEPIDTTKKRLRNAVGLVGNYDNELESLAVTTYGDGAYAFFILRQDYQIGGKLVEEYLPTTWVLERMEGKWKVVHAHRSADFETIRQLMLRAQPEG